LAATVSLSIIAGSDASVEWLVQKTLDLGETPLDVAVTADGARTFILTEEGNILIYSAGGELEEKVSIGEPADGIAVSPRGDRIFLSNRKNKAVKIVSLDFVQKIDETGSPIKGPAGAPVAVAVYSDFQ
jgi:DNA-binding beta-propeller fold protein YncE